MRTMNHAVAVIVASTLALGSIATLVAADWPSFRGPNHDGKSAETIKWTEPKLEFNGLIAVGGKLLVLTEKGDLVLAEASPAGYKELGSAHVIAGRAFTAPVFANGRVYARNTVGDVVSVDLTAK